MATAIKSTVDVEVRKIEKQDAIVLTLSMDESVVLRRILGNIGGGGPIREHVNHIYHALQPHVPGCFTNPFVDYAELKKWA